MGGWNSTALHPTMAPTQAGEAGDSDPSANDHDEAGDSDPYYDQNDYAIIEVIQDHFSDVRAVACTHDSIFSGGVNNVLIKSDLQTGEEIESRGNAHGDNYVYGDPFDEDPGGGVGIWALATDGEIIVSCGVHDTTVKVWNMDLDLQQSLKGHSGDGVHDVAIFPNSPTPRLHVVMTMGM